LCESERKKWKIDFKERLDSDVLFNQICADFNEADYEKLALNKKIFH
jgi:hypothetical protein